MYWPLWTSLVVAMHGDIENTSAGTDHVITVIYQSIALPTGRQGKHDVTYTYWGRSP